MLIKARILVVIWRQGGLKFAVIILSLNILQLEKNAVPVLNGTHFNIGGRLREGAAMLNRLVVLHKGRIFGNTETPIDG